MKSYALPPQLYNGALLPLLQETFRITAHKCEQGQREYLDSFDGRLYRQGLLLMRENSQYTLRKLRSGKILCQDNQSGRRILRMADDFQDAQLRSQLSEWLQMRALIPLLQLEYHLRPYAIMNQDQKTVLRLWLTAFTLPPDIHSSKRWEILQLEKIRGYQDSARQFRKWLQERDFCRHLAHVLEPVFTDLDLRPDAYTSKPPLTLFPAMPSHRAVAQILQALFTVMRQNEEGLQADIDTEFLHDFRVAIRRTRSLLGQLKGVFPAQQLQHFRNEFSYWGKSSNRLRDLDVYLLKKEHFRSLLPPTLHEGLDELMRQLRQARSRERRRFVRRLQTRRYQRFTAEWQAFLSTLEQQAAADAADGTRDIYVLARKKIRRRYHKILRIVKQLEWTAADAQLHSLRLECKQLRYLLEFFHSLFPPAKMDRLIVQLKDLQDYLGEFNDLSVQQDFLNAFLETLPDETEKRQDVVAAVGGLIVKLKEQQDHNRAAAAVHIAAFTNTDSKRTIAKLFGKHSGSK